MDQKEIKYLTRERSRYISLKANIERVIRPKIVDLVKGSFDNVKNISIVSGALGSFSLFFFNNNPSLISQRIALISISGFLLVTLLGAVIVSTVHRKQLRVWVQALNKEKKDANRFLELIEQRLSNDISAEKYKEEEERLLLDVNENKLKFNPEEKDDVEELDYADDFLVILFVISIILSIISLWLRLY